MRIALSALGTALLFLALPLLIARRLNRVSSSYRRPRRRWYWLGRRPANR